MMGRFKIAVVVAGLLPAVPLMAQNAGMSAFASGSYQVAEATPTAAERAAEKQLFIRALTTGDAADYEAYLDVYPNGEYSVLARFEVKSRAKKAAQAQAQAAANQKQRANEERQLALKREAAQLRAVEEDAKRRAAAQRAADAKKREEALAASNDGITFDAPMGSIDPVLNGLAIQDVIIMRPEFPPIAGLPDQVWKDKQCSDCHQWNKQTLCVPATHYTKAKGEASLDKPHPFGGAFKQVLRAWADGGCG